MKIKILIFFLFFFNLVKSQIILSISPSLVYENDIVTIKGTNFSLNQPTSVFKLQFGQLIYNVDITIVDQNTVTISPIFWKNRFSGDLNIYYVLNSVISNRVNITILKPIITGSIYHSISNQYEVYGYFTTLYPIYLRNVTLNEPILSSNTTFTNIIFDNPILIFGVPVIEINNINYTFPDNVYNSYLASNLKSDPIERSNNQITIYGEYLTYIIGDRPIFSLFLFSQEENISSCSNIYSQRIYNQTYSLSFQISEYIKNPRIDVVYINNFYYLSHPIKYIQPKVDSISSTFFNEPSEVIIYGSSFCPEPNITIGGLYCPLRYTDEWKIGKLYCQFYSNVTSIDNQPLRVNVSCDDNIFSTINYGYSDIFLYGKNECFFGKNNLLCSGNGYCDSTSKKCICVDKYSGSDCSIDSLVPPPIPSTENTTTTIEFGDSKFQIGIVQIREFNISGGIVSVFNLTNAYQHWELEEMVNQNLFTYKTILSNNAIISVQMFINNGLETVLYDFYGDIFEISPNSIKYNIEISNWSFLSLLNQLQLIFKTEITTYSDCDEEIISNDQHTQTIDGSIRTIQLSLIDGQNLYGFFSNRMKLDNKVVQSLTTLLNDNESIGIPTISNDTNEQQQKQQQQQVSFIAISIPNFQHQTIIDPNFELILQNNFTFNSDNCRVKQTWKIAVFVVISAVGFGLMVVLLFLLYKRYKNSTIILFFRAKRSEFKMKELKQNKKK